MSRLKTFLWGVASTLFVLLVLALVVASERRGVSYRSRYSDDGVLEGNMPSAPPPMAGAPEPMMAKEEDAKVSAAKVMKKRAASPGLNRLLGGKGGEGFGEDMAGGAALAESAKPGAQPVLQDVEDAPVASTDGKPASAPSRSWFPETLLFEPLVVTDGSGHATVPVKVPDRLTQWRVLALAHSREGAQAGTTAHFLGTLPLYVEPVVPPFLLVGDEVRLPVQVVNTTAAEVSRPLKVEASGASLSASGGAVRIPAGGSRVEYVTVRANAPGKVVLRATLGDADALVRDFDVLPQGHPVFVQRGGSLGAPRSFNLKGPEDADPSTERVRLLVYPGALALLRAELTAASTRSGPAADAYVLLLAGRAPELLHALGEKPEVEVLRTLSITAGQRVLKASRTPDAAAAALFAEAALAHPESPVLTRLGERLSAKVAETQRPDGSCQGGNGWSLQRVLVATAECVRAARADPSPAGRRRAQSVALRAQGVFERQLEHIQDGYTAAAILASGPLPSSLEGPLRARVREALRTSNDGARFLGVDSLITRADGQHPSDVEATALAVLALQQEGKAELPDLGSFLLAGYSPGSGWGDGYANLVCLQAVLALFKDPLPPQVKVVLERDGHLITEGTLDAQALRQVVAMEAEAKGSSGEHGWKVRAEPPVPGLGFSLALQGYAPWTQEKKKEKPSGFELAITSSAPLRVGQPVEVTLTAVMPAHTPVRIRHALPAGVQPDASTLQALVAAGSLTRYEAADGLLTLEVPPRPPAETFRISYKVLPTLSGTLHAQASSIEAMGQPESAFHVPPVIWPVR